MIGEEYRCACIRRLARCSTWHSVHGTGRERNRVRVARGKFVRHLSLAHPCGTADAPHVEPRSIVARTISVGLATYPLLNARSTGEEIIVLQSDATLASAILPHPPSWRALSCRGRSATVQAPRTTRLLPEGSCRSRAGRRPLQHLTREPCHARDRAVHSMSGAVP